jgi:DNA-binding transcriptional MerR regulator
MFTVSELANRAKVTPDTVRHYVHIGLLNPSRDPQNGYKLFENTDIQRLRFVRQAQTLGFSLTEIDEVLSHSVRGDSPCPRVREIIQRRIDENRMRLDALNALQARMEHALKKWGSMRDGMPNGDSVCHLIESVLP